MDVLHSELTSTTSPTTNNNNSHVEEDSLELLRRTPSDTKYWEEAIQLRFVLDLDLVKEEFSKPLSVMVATVLGLHKTHDYLFAWTKYKQK